MVFFSPSYIHCTAMRSVCVWQRRQPQLLGEKEKEIPNQHAKKVVKLWAEVSFEIISNQQKRTEENNK